MPPLSLIVFTLLGLGPRGLATELLYPCINFCLKYDENLVEYDPDADCKAFLLPQVSCPSWLTPDMWDPVGFEDYLNEKICLCDSPGHWEGGEPYESGDFVQACTMCHPDITNENAHQLCIDSVKPSCSPSGQSSVTTTTTSSSTKSIPTRSSHTTTSLSITAILSITTTSSSTTSSLTHPEPSCSAATVPDLTEIGADEPVPAVVVRMFEEAAHLVRGTYRNQQVPGTQFMWKEEFDAGGSEGYIAVDDSKADPRIAIIFAGSTSIDDWITNFHFEDFPQVLEQCMGYMRGFLGFVDTILDSFRPEEPIDIPGLEACQDCFIHPGFLIRSHSIQQIVTPLVQKYKKDYPCHRVIVIGHSQGGAFAEIMGTAWKNSGIDVEVITFGSPRAGNPAWAAYVDSTFSKQAKLSRLTHKGDIIPHLPFHIASLDIPGFNLPGHDFQHPETEYWIPKPDLPAENVLKCGGDEDPACMQSENAAILQRLVKVLTEVALGGSLLVELPVKEPAIALLADAFREVDGMFYAHFDYFLRIAF